jgi:hypothetical protein
MKPFGEENDYAPCYAQLCYLSYAGSGKLEKKVSRKPHRRENLKVQLGWKIHT